MKLSGFVLTWRKFLLTWFIQQHSDKFRKLPLILFERHKPTKSKTYISKLWILLLSGTYKSVFRFYNIILVVVKLKCPFKTCVLRHHTWKILRMVSFLISYQNTYNVLFLKKTQLQTGDWITVDSRLHIHKVMITNWLIGFHLTMMSKLRQQLLSGNWCFYIYSHLNHIIEWSSYTLVKLIDTFN